MTVSMLNKDNKLCSSCCHLCSSSAAILLTLAFLWYANILCSLVSTSLLEVSRPHVPQSQFDFVAPEIRASYHTYFQKTPVRLFLLLKMYPSNMPNFSLKYVVKAEGQIEITTHKSIFFTWTEEIWDSVSSSFPQNKLFNSFQTKNLSLVY